ncbi:hypothetical protein Pmani_016950 [Petrolisthes manimaculis]|uniref:Uncharacterized protein n=1 Tax=Petrolisthes manimaculis TaxID=1843537 RepID=A0AAE1U683_9EUCA|nr:hypothetical protein Pmani_016950 [Petrolisthes manimaculis]
MRKCRRKEVVGIRVGFCEEVGRSGKKGVVGIRVGRSGKKGVVGIRVGFCEGVGRSGKKEVVGIEVERREWLEYEWGSVREWGEVERRKGTG